MPTMKRQGRAAEMIQETLSVLLTQAADERLNTIVITEVEVNQDLSAAKVWYTISGDTADKKAAQEGLKHAAGFLRTEVAETLDLRRAPTLTFHYDQDAVRVVVAITICVTVWTLLVLAFAYPLLRKVVLGISRRVLASPARLVGFTAALLLVPIALIAI